jgi:FkbM family methyltransferase
MKRLFKRLLIFLRIFYQIKDLAFFKIPIHQKQKEFYESLISKEDLVFDVGANIGQRSYIFQAIAKKVIAYEPQPSCLQILNSRFAFKSQVQVSAIALSHQKGKATMHISDASTLSTLSEDFVEGAGKRIFKRHNWDTKVEVKTDTLDGQIARFGCPSFIKIDVEGFETAVIRGLNENVTSLSFEFIPGETNKTFECLKHLHKLSKAYRFNLTLGEELEFVFREHLSYSEFILQDELKNAPSFGDIYALITK